MLLKILRINYFKVKILKQQNKVQNLLKVKKQKIKSLYVRHLRLKFRNVINNILKAIIKKKINIKINLRLKTLWVKNKLLLKHILRVKRKKKYQPLRIRVKINLNINQEVLKRKNLKRVTTKVYNSLNFRLKKN